MGLEISLRARQQIAQWRHNPTFCPIREEQSKIRSKKWGRSGRVLHGAGEKVPKEVRPVFRETNYPSRRPDVRSGCSHFHVELFFVEVAGTKKNCSDEISSWLRTGDAAAADSCARKAAAISTKHLRPRWRQSESTAAIRPDRRCRKGCLRLWSGEREVGFFKTVQMPIRLANVRSGKIMIWKLTASIIATLESTSTTTTTTSTSTSTTTSTSSAGAKFSSLNSCSKWSVAWEEIN